MDKKAGASHEIPKQNETDKKTGGAHTSVDQCPRAAGQKLAMLQSNKTTLAVTKNSKMEASRGVIIFGFPYRTTSAESPLAITPRSDCGRTWAIE